MIDSKDIKADLEDLAKQFDRSDEKAAERLRELSYAVDGGSYADAWATTDLHRMIEIDTIVQRYKRHYRVDKAVIITELIRNSVIFAPLIVTWYGISIAVAAYHNLIGQKPDLGTYPFLYLWQGGFEGRLQPWQTLAGLATIDALLLSLVLILTIAVSYLSSLAKEKQEWKAEELRDRLIHTVARATLCLHTRTWKEPANFVDRLNQTTEQFRSVVEQLVQQIKDERKVLGELAVQQKEDMRAFKSLKSDLYTIMNNVSKSMNEMQESTKVLSGTINSLVEPAQTGVKQQEILLKNSHQVVDLLKEHSVAQKKVVEQQEYWGKELQKVLNMLDGTVKQGKELASSVAAFTGQQTGFLESIKQEREQQELLTNRMFTLTEGLRKILVQMDESLTEWKAVDVNLYELVKHIAAKQFRV